MEEEDIYEEINKIHCKLYCQRINLNILAHSFWEDEDDLLLSDNEEAKFPLGRCERPNSANILRNNQEEALNRDQLQLNRMTSNTRKYREARSTMYVRVKAKQHNDGF